MTVWKRTVGPECGPDDEYECCACGRVFARSAVTPLDDGWYCLPCAGEDKLTEEDASEG